MSFFRNRTVLGIICILLSLGICFGVTPIFNAAVSEKVTIARVKTTIPTGTQITSNMLETVEVGGYNLPSNIVEESANVVGSYALADMHSGDYVLESKISPTKQAENAYLYNLDGTKQAMSISIKSFASGLSGKLESGDIVSIISGDYDNPLVTAIPEELKYVEIISVTASSGTDANTGKEVGTDEERELPSTITLLVTPEQSLILADLEIDGDVHVALVYRGSAENCAKFIDIQDEILAEKYDEDSEGEDGEKVSVKVSTILPNIVDTANEILNNANTNIDDVLDGVNTNVDEILNSEVG